MASPSSTPGPDDKNSGDKNTGGSLIRQLALAMELPFVMIASVLIGGGIGYLLDRPLHTSPALMLVGGFAGFGAGIWDIIRRLSHAEKK